MKTKLMILSAAALIFTAAGNLTAAGSRGPAEERSGSRSEKRPVSRAEKGEHTRDGSWLEKKLELTETQKEELREHRNQRENERREVFTSMREKEQALREELARDEVDREKVDKIIDEISALHKKQLKQRTESLLQLREVLTDEQLEKIRDHKKDNNPYGHGKSVPREKTKPRGYGK